MDRALSAKVDNASDGIVSCRWSVQLGELLLASVSDGELAKHWGFDTETMTSGSSEMLDIREELLRWAATDWEVRRWIADAWRSRNDDVIEQTESGTAHELCCQAESLLEQFEPTDILLSLITEGDEGWQLAETFVHGVSDDRSRRVLMQTLLQLTGVCSDREPQVRVVIFGGHPRIGLRLLPTLQAKGSFEIRWRAFEHKHSGGVAEKSVAASLHDADAAIVVTGMASHALTRLVKNHSQLRHIPCRCVEKATEMQLTEALMEMFPLP